MEPELRLRIVLYDPPAGVDFGLQNGSGNNYETIQKQRSVGKELIFLLDVRVKNNQDLMVDFRGPFVQGPAGHRFIYIDIGTYAGQADAAWGRRLKIPLTGITQTIIKHLMADASAVLEARVAGTGKDGGPNCATVKPFAGWKLAGEIIV